MNDEFETQIQIIAQNLPYPPTPALRHTPLPRAAARLRWRHAIVFVLLLGLSGLLVPEIRAVVMEFLQIGAVRIYLDGVGTTGEPLNLEHVSGEMELKEAQALVSFPIRLPPDDLPDRVFVQDHSLAIFVWVSGGKIERALYETTSDDVWMMIKKTAENITITSVAGRDAAWVTLDHPIEFIRDGVVQSELTHFVTGNVLIWDQGRVTYRLETSLSLDEARQFAESLIVLE
jgi:hypothetical protein